jgi:hypothetical protein
VVAWALACTALLHATRRIGPAWARFALALAPFAFDGVRGWVFGYGMFGAEGLSLPLFVAALALFVLWLRTDERRVLLTTAVLFALLAYIRSYFEILGNFAIAALVFYAMVKLTYLILVERILSPGLRSREIAARLASGGSLFTPRLKAGLSAGVLFVVLLLPWRLYNLERGAPFSWTSTDQAWAAQWRPDADYPVYKFPAINTPCHIAEDLCRQLHPLQHQDTWATPRLGATFYKTLSVYVMLRHPLDWVKDKLRYSYAFWFGPVRGRVIGDDWRHEWRLLVSRDWRYFAEGILTLMVGVGTLSWMSGSRRLHRAMPGRIFLAAAWLFVAANAVIFAFVHFEARYSLFIRVFFLYLPLLALALARDAGSAERAK